MERLEERTVEEMRLSNEEVQAVLQRLRGAEEAPGTTVSDLSEATGVSPARISEVLAFVRQEALAQRSATTVVRKPRALKEVLAAATALVVAVTLLNAPLFRGPRVTVANVSAHRVIDSYGEGTNGTRIKVRVKTHPETLWGRLFPPGSPYNTGKPSLLTPEGEVESVRFGDTTEHPIFDGDYERTTSGDYEATYEYPEVAIMQRATHLHDRIVFGGETMDLEVPLPPSP